jgi:hypothetical protein
MAPAALRHEVARRLANANCGRPLALFWRKASATRFRLTVRKDD